MSVGSSWSREVDALFDVARARKLYVELHVGDYDDHTGRRPYRFWRLVELRARRRPRLVAQQPIWRDDTHALRAAACVMLRDLSA